jgi:hypothetical protein
LAATPDELPTAVPPAAPSAPVDPELARDALPEAPPVAPSDPTTPLPHAAMDIPQTTTPRRMPM